MVVIIPAYNPDYHLLDVLKELKNLLDNKIIIVNDGSDNTDEINKIFEHAKEYGIIINHKVNMGKGAAMKTGMKYVKDQYPYEDGITFVDCDHQHKAPDVKKMIESFNNNKDSLILGVRVFDKDVPIKSRLGNKITRNIFKLLTRKYISDTQTGLRSINTKYIPLLLNIEPNRFDYEMDMLITFVKNNINIVEVSIETIYENKENKTSHFRGFKDSYLIYKILLKDKKR